MAIALEGIADAAVLVLIAITLVLLGCAALLQGGLGLIADAIRNLSVAGVHFGKPIAEKLDAVGEAIVNWLLHWLHVEVHWLTTLLEGMAWAVRETWNGIVSAYDAVSHAFDWVIHDFIPREIHALRHYVEGLISKLDTFAHEVQAELRHKAAQLGHEIEALAHRVPHLIDIAIHDFNVAVVRPLERGLHYAEHEIASVIEPKIAALEHGLTDIRDAVLGAVGTIEDVLPRLPSIGFDDLEALWQRIPWRSMAGLLSLGFLTHALLRALAREAGLDSAECRGKVKGICGADPSAWTSLLAGLLGGMALLDFRELARVGGDLVRELESELRQYGDHH